MMKNDPGIPHVMINLLEYLERAGADLVDRKVTLACRGAAEICGYRREGQPRPGSQHRGEFLVLAVDIVAKVECAVAIPDRGQIEEIDRDRFLQRTEYGFVGYERVLKALRGLPSALEQARGDGRNLLDPDAAMAEEPFHPREEILCGCIVKTRLGSSNLILPSAWSDPGYWRI